MKIIRQREQHTETTHEHVSGFVDLGPVPITRQWTDPAVGLCDACGCEVEISSSIRNTCYRCGSRYDSDGERIVIAKHEQGEHSNAL